MTNQEAYRNVVSKLSEEDYNIVADYVTKLEHKYCVLEKALGKEHIQEKIIRYKNEEIETYKEYCDELEKQVVIMREYICSKCNSKECSGCDLRGNKNGV